MNDLTKPGRWTRKARIRQLIYILLISGVFLALHFANYDLQGSSDWSQNQRGTLTQESIDLLARFDGPLVIKAYYENRADLRAQIQRVVAKYQRWKPNIQLEYISTSLAREEIEKLGFSHLGQTILQFNDQQQRITSLDEKTVSNALFNLIRKDTPWIIMLQGHGERDPYDEGVHGYSQLAQSLASRGSKVQPLNLLKNPFIPDNTTLLTIAGARQPFSAGELDLILKYLGDGGNLLLLVDPDTQANLNAVLAELGIQAVEGVVIDGNTQLRNLLGIKHPAVIPVVEYAQHSINQKLKHQTLFPFAQGLVTGGSTDWRYQPLFYSHERSWSETGNLLDEHLQYDEQLGDQKGPILLGVALEREHADKHQRVVVIGDSDFTANGYFSQGANAQLVLNTINWQNEDEQLIAISPPLATDQLSGLNDKTIIAIALLFLLILPIALISVGIGLYLRHSRQ